MDTRAIVRDGLMRSGRRLWTAALGFGFTYIAAAFLRPKGLGFLSLLRMIPSLAVRISLGWVKAFCREVLHRRGAGQPHHGQHTRAVAYTAEIFMALL